MKVNVICPVLVCLLYLQCHQCFIFGPKRLFNGRITPLYPRVCNGQSLTLRCELLDTPSPDRTIYFAISIPPEDYKIAGEQDIVREGVKSANLTIRSLPLIDNIIHVICYYGQPSDFSNKTLHLTDDSVSFQVYEMPRRVENFKCVLEHYKTLVCTWEHVIKYDSFAPDVTLEWQISGETEWQQCPNMDYTQCTLSLSDNELMNNLVMRVTVNKTQCDTVLTQYFNITPRLMVKPGPVTGIKAEVINTTCALLQWNNAEITVQGYEHTHRIQIHSVWGSTEIIHEDVQNSIDSHRSRVLCDLEEDTVYTLTVSQKPSTSGYWSDVAAVKITTLKDVPSTSPTVLPGGYFWDPDDCSSNEDRRRKVCVLWKDIDTIDENGEMRGIDVKFTQTGSDEAEVYKALSEDSTFTCAQLLCDVSYNVAIKARNEIGKSRVPSIIRIERWNPDLKQPHFTVERSISSVYVSYTEPEPATATDVYLFWCVKSDGRCSNNGQWRWKKFSPNETMTQVITESPERYAYSVSMVRNGVSYGSQLEHCIYTKNAAPSLAPHNVMVSAGSEDNTLVVTWEKLACKSGQPVIVSYRVKYCHISNGKCSTRDVAASVSRVVLENLEDGEEYAVQVQGIAANNTHGPYSQTVSGIPEHNGLDVPDIIGLSCGGLALILMASIGCLFIIRMMRKRTARWKAKVSGVKIPEHIMCPPPSLMGDPEKPLTKLDVRKLSTDSGVPSTPSPTGIEGTSLTWSTT